MADSAAAACLSHGLTSADQPQVSRYVSGLSRVATASRARSCRAPLRSAARVAASMHTVPVPGARKRPAGRTTSTVAVAPALSAESSGTALLEWATQRGLRAAAVAPGAGGLVTTRGVRAGDILLQVPDALAVTTTDVTAHPLVASLADGRGELVGLALWLLAERVAGPQSQWAPFLETLPQTTVTPMLWSPELRRSLLKGSTALAAADERAAALASEWASLAPLLEAAPAMYPPASWTQRAFGDALAVVLAHAVYLPSARCFALLPLASNVTRRSPGFTGDGGVSATLDYDHGSSAVVLLATSDLVAGQEVVAADAQQRNSAELLLSGCELGGPNGTTAFAGDTLTWTASLLSTDRLYSAKAATLEAAGLLPSEQSFPVCAELGMPTQLLTYLRMSRITDAAELMKVRFDQDAIITPMNEYEVLQLMMGDCRERLAAYDGGMEDEVKLLQDRTLTREARQAAALRLSEKRILNEVMASVRRRLAPIRGIPTKSGMESANSDLLEIFDTLENLNKKPMEIVREMLGWDESNQPKPKGGGGCS